MLRSLLFIACLGVAPLTACSQPPHDKAMDLAQCRLDEGSVTGKRARSLARTTTDFLTTCMRGKGWQPVHDAPLGTVCAEVMLAPLDDTCYVPIATP